MKQIKEKHSVLMRWTLPPTLFYFNSDGTLAKKWEGFADADKLLALVP